MCHFDKLYDSNEQHTADCQVVYNSNQQRGCVCLK